MKSLFSIFLLIGFVSTCFGLSCLPCEKAGCKSAVCTTKIVKDACGCCDVCSKSIGEKCGGPWNISGLCDNGLKCHRLVRPGQLEFNIEGTCENNTRGGCLHPTKFSECASACQSRCDEREPLICTLQCIANPCVCKQGFIRRSATDDTCIPVDECPPKVTCEFPKVFRSCATACPKTCGNPYPYRCTKNCNLDQCVCPEGYILNSLTEKRCIRNYECEDFSFCRMDCLPLTIGASTCDLPAKWVCELTNWKCDAYEWKMEMEKWWFGSGCSVDDKGLWDMFDKIISDCPLQPTCKNLDATECKSDGFGCRSCTCSDGKYEDISQLPVIASRNHARYLELMNVYRSARDRCQSMTGC
ncbi:cysteine-rich motor neuron 1 protein-like isoform X1 [Styela clava]